jgi:hypothetical protein
MLDFKERVVWHLSGFEFIPLSTISMIIRLTPVPLSQSLLSLELKGTLLGGSLPFSVARLEVRLFQYLFIQALGSEGVAGDTSILLIVDILLESPLAELAVGLGEVELRELGLFLLLNGGQLLDLIEDPLVEGTSLELGTT